VHFIDTDTHPSIHTGTISEWRKLKVQLTLHTSSLSRELPNSSIVHYGLGGLTHVHVKHGRSWPKLSSFQTHIPSVLEAFSIYSTMVTRNEPD
jgi:hypothetical protein